MNMQELKELGITEEKILDAIVQNVLYTGEGDEVYQTEFLKTLRKSATSMIQKRVDEVATTTILPSVTKMIEDACLQPTNQWGEARGPAMTFKEYLVHCCENYMCEKVDSGGKSKKESDSSYWREETTRVTHLINKMLHWQIETAIKDALANLNSQVAKGLHEAVKSAIDNALKGLKVQTSI